MEKPAVTKHPVHDLIARRWSPRAFSAKAIPANVLHSILTAGSWAASSYNEQPWYYIVVSKADSADEFQKMVDCLVEQNQEWAKGAPILMISVMKTTFSREGNPPNRVAMHDVGAASTTMALQAVAHGVFVHQMAGIFPEKIRSTYKIPQGYEPVAALAFGYPGESEALSEDFRHAEKAPRVRKELKEYVYSGLWGTTSPLI